jgi:hypothetical protein
MTSPETPQQAYDRGADAGRIEQRLATYDRHFETINGSVMDTAKQLKELSLQVQRLVDRMDANAATVLATANALKAADEARRDKTEQSWSPWQKVLATLAGLAALVGAVLGILALRGK